MGREGSCGSGQEGRGHSICRGYARPIRKPGRHGPNVRRNPALGWPGRRKAYSRYALEANRKTTNLATFRAVAAKYPQKRPADILRDLVAHTPGEEGKWFAAAKSVGLYDEAIDLANRTPCDPKTLTRAARDMASKNPRFAAEAGLAALRWLAAGYGYDIIGADVSGAYRHTVQAAANAGCLPQAMARIRTLVENASPDGFFATGIVRRAIECDPANKTTERGGIE
jgi:hypothetical protein